MFKTINVNNQIGGCYADIWEIEGTNNERGMFFEGFFMEETVSAWQYSEFQFDIHVSEEYWIRITANSPLQPQPEFKFSVELLGETGVVTTHHIWCEDTAALAEKIEAETGLELGGIFSLRPATAADYVRRLRSFFAN